MVGDGINDVLSLVCVLIGMVIGVGIDIVIDFVDVVLINSDLKDILYFFDLVK